MDGFYETGSKPWYQHTLSDGNTVDEAYPGQFYVVGHGTQPTLGVFGSNGYMPGGSMQVPDIPKYGGGSSSKTTASSAERSAPVSQGSTSRYTGGVVVRPPSSSSVVMRPPSSSSTTSPNLSHLAKLVSVAKPIIAYYNTWVGTASGGPRAKLVGVAPGIHAPPPVRGGDWWDYDKGLVGELNYLSYQLPHSGPSPYPTGGTTYGSCSSSKGGKVVLCAQWLAPPHIPHLFGKVAKKCTKKYYGPDRYRCALNSIADTNSVWHYKLKSAYDALERGGGGNPRTLIGGLKKDLRSYLKNLLAATAATPNMVSPAGVAGYLAQAPAVPSEDQIGGYLRHTLERYKSEKMAKYGLSKQLLLSRPSRQIVRFPIRKVPGGYVHLPGKLPGATIPGPGEVTYPEWGLPPGAETQPGDVTPSPCPAGYEYVGMDGEDALCAPIATDAPPGQDVLAPSGDAADKDTKEDKKEKPKDEEGMSDTMKYGLIAAGVAVVAVVVYKGTQK